MELVQNYIKFAIISFALISFVSCELDPEDVEEGTECISPEPVPENFGVMQKLINIPNPEGFYVSMGSSHLYRSYASYLLGHSAKDQLELDSMNLRIKYVQLANKWLTSGYDGQTFSQTCAPKGSIFRNYCVAGFGSQGTNLENIRETVDTLVYTKITSNNSIFLITRCVMGHENDWKVLSIKPSIDSSTTKSIINKIVELGYNASFVSYQQY